MRTRAARGSFLDPRTKILIWLLANVVVFTWTPAVFRVAVMLAYFGLFLLERKGKMLVGLLLVYLVIVAVQFWLLPLLPGSLATVFATVTYFILVFPCIAGGAYIIATTNVSQFMAALERLGAPRSFSITLAVTSGFAGAPSGLRHIRDAMALRRIRGLEEKLSVSGVPMLMGRPNSGGAQRVRHCLGIEHQENVLLAAHRISHSRCGHDFAVPGPVRGRDLLQGVLP